MRIDGAFGVQTAARIARSAVVLAVCGAAAGWGLFGADLPRGHEWLSPTKSQGAPQLRARVRADIHSVRDR